MQVRLVKIGKTGMKIRAVRDDAKPPKKQPLPWDMGFTPQTWAEKVISGSFGFRDLAMATPSPSVSVPHYKFRAAGIPTDRVKGRL